MEGEEERRCIFDLLMFGFFSSSLSLSPYLRKIDASIKLYADCFVVRVVFLVSFSFFGFFYSTKKREREKNEEKRERIGSRLTTNDVKRTAVVMVVCILPADTQKERKENSIAATAAAAAAAAAAATSRFLHIFLFLSLSRSLARSLFL